MTGVRCIYQYIRLCCACLPDLPILEPPPFEPAGCAPRLNQLQGNHPTAHPACAMTCLALRQPILQAGCLVWRSGTSSCMRDALSSAPAPYPAWRMPCLALRQPILYAGYPVCGFARLSYMQDAPSRTHAVRPTSRTPYLALRRRSLHMKGSVPHSDSPPC